MIKNLSLVSLILLAFFETGCGDCKILGVDASSLLRCNKPQENTAQISCPDPADTSIVNGIQNDFSVTMDRAGGFQSTLHFKTALPHYGLHRLVWSPGVNRSTCSGGGLVSEGFNTYLRLNMSPTLMDMRVVAGDNYFDYIAYGCRTASEVTCTEVIEEGTAVIHVTHVP
jgi:hypothetical protein